MIKTTTTIMTAFRTLKMMTMTMMESLMPRMKMMTMTELWTVRILTQNPEAMILMATVRKLDASTTWVPFRRVFARHGMCHLQMLTSILFASDLQPSFQTNYRNSTTDFDTIHRYKQSVIMLTNFLNSDANTNVSLMNAKICFIWFIILAMFES